VAAHKKVLDDFVDAFKPGIVAERRLYGFRPSDLSGERDHELVRKNAARLQGTVYEKRTAGGTDDMVRDNPGTPARPGPSAASTPTEARLGDDRAEPGIQSSEQQALSEFGISERGAKIVDVVGSSVPMKAMTKSARKRTARTRRIEEEGRKAFQALADKVQKVGPDMIGRAPKPPLVSAGDKRSLTLVA
jgi:hypothetical protein